MKKLLITAGLFFLPWVAHAGTITTSFSPLGTITISSGTASTTDTIAFDAVSSSGAFTDQATPLTWTHTVGVGTDRVIVVGCGTGSGDNVTGITVGGAGMTLSTSSILNSLVRTFIYTLANPSSGAQTISVSDVASHTSRLSCAAVSFSGAKQTSPVDSSTSTVSYPGGGTITSTWNTTIANDVLIDVVADGGETGTLVAGSLQAQKYQKGEPNNYYVVGVSTKAATTAGSYTMTWTGASGANVCSSAVAIQPGP